MMIVVRSPCQHVEGHTFYLPTVRSGLFQSRSNTSPAAFRQTAAENSIGAAIGRMESMDAQIRAMRLVGPTTTRHALRCCWT